MNGIITIRNLTTWFDTQYIHQNLDLDITEHLVTAIVGGSGSGKTTLMRAILMLQPFTGSIRIMGNDLLDADPAVRERIRKLWGVMFQHSALFSSLTVIENIAFPLMEYTKLDKNSIYELAAIKMTLVGLAVKHANKFPAELSGGMQKRVALARAIALDPKLLFLDEPSAGLDPQSASGLDELIINLKESLGLTIIMITHDLDSLWRVADEVAFLGDGKVLAKGKIAELYESNMPAVRAYFSNQRAMIRREKSEINSDGN